MVLIQITTRTPKPPDATAISTFDPQGSVNGHAAFRDTPDDWNSFKASFLTGRGRPLSQKIDTVSRPGLA